MAEIKRVLRVSDEKYCAKCIYRGSFTQNYLCNYISMVGHMRGCPPGVGCNQRILAKNVRERRDPMIDRTCQMCGATYQGTSQSHYCMACRRKLVKQATIERIARKKEQNK